jgi:hypothetical protein
MARLRERVAAPARPAELLAVGPSHDGPGEHHGDRLVAAVERELLAGLERPVAQLDDLGMRAGRHECLEHGR